MADSGCEDTVPTLSTMVHTCKLPEESDASMRARLFTSLSQSFPHSQLYKALHGGEDINLNGGDNSEDDDDSLYGDHLSNSCFASLRMDRRDSDDFDDDLRSLGWLQNEDLLKNIGGEKLDKEDDSEEQKENEDIKPDISLLQGATVQQSPNIIPLPEKYVNCKPPYSFSCLIFMAVEASPQKRLPVKDIYNWILTQFPYFQNAPSGWKNSVRHNLSLNKCFKKVEKDKGQSIGKGSLWCIDPAYRPNLLQALRKTPYHPYHQLQMTSTQPQNYIQYQSLPGGGRTVLPLTQRPVPNTVSPHLFPFLSRRLAQTSFDVDNEMKDVAQTLVALKGSYRKESPDSSSDEDVGPTWRHNKKSLRRPSSPVVVTDHPYDDHAYSSTRVLDDDAPSPSSSSSIDVEYDFGDADEECDSEYNSGMEWDSDNKDDVDGDLPSSKKLKIDMQEEGGGTSTSGKVVGVVDESEDDEQKKIHEGASALLNLAGLLLNHRNNSVSPDAGMPDKKKDRWCEKDERREKTRRISKKARGASKKSAAVLLKESDERQRKRSVSRRKNAGSNGKYDTGEYSLIKPSKTVAKSRPSSTSIRKNVKAETPKSAIGTDSDKIPGSTPKNKPLKSNASKKATKKGIAGKQKLKLSKTFSASNKSGNSLTDKNMSTTDDKAHKNQTQNSKSKKNLSKKGISKGMQSSSLKKAKTRNDNSGGSKITSTNENGLVTYESTKRTSGSDNVSNNNSVKDLEKLAHSENTSADRKELGENLTKVQTLTVVPFVNGEIISPAGDAPTKPKEASDTVGSDTTSETRLSAKSSPSTICSSSNDHVSKSIGRKSSPCRHNVPDLPSTVAIHKSPHFTRFSKKKAALS